MRTLTETPGWGYPYPTDGGARRPGRPYAAMSRTRLKPTMGSMNAPLPPDPDPGLLSRAVRRVGTASAKRPKRVIALWLLLVIGCVTAGAMTGTKTLDGPDAGTGDSQKADRQIKAAGLEDQATESI